jgi:precorrin-6B methylase 2
MVPIVRSFHAGSALENAVIERALGIARPNEKRSANLVSLLHRFGNQNFEFETMSFRDLREVFHSVELGPEDLFCDAGAGYGHAVFYGASVAPCRFRAIELLPFRCAAMRKTAARLGLSNVEIVEGDALTQSYAEVTCVFANNPFFPDVADRFIRQLKTERRHPLTVIAAHAIVDAFRGDSDFAEVETRADLPNYCFGVFRLKPRRANGRRITPAGSAPSQP